MKNILFANMIAQASALENYANTSLLQNQVEDQIFDVMSLVMGIFTFIPLIMFAAVMIIVIVAVKSQSKMRNNMSDMNNRVQDNINKAMNNINMARKEEAKVEPKVETKVESPVNTDPQGVIDLDQVVDLGNTDPIKKR